MKRKTQKYYAVFKGRNGNKIYNTWEECQQDSIGWKGVKFKSFLTEDECKTWLEEKETPPVLGEKKSRTSVTDETKTKKAKKEKSEDEEAMKLKYEHTVDNDSKDLVIYTDGSCTTRIENGRIIKKTGCGVYFGENDERNMSQLLPLKYNQTNNGAELYALLLALKWLYANKSLGWRDKKKVIIRPDSMYTINSTVTWRESQERRGLKTVDGRPLENLELILEIRKMLDNLELFYNIEFLHVKGHAGHKANEAADILAKNAK